MTMHPKFLNDVLHETTFPGHFLSMWLLEGADMRNSVTTGARSSVDVLKITYQI